MSNLNEIIERVDALRNNYTPDGFPVLSHLCHELAAIRDALRALPSAVAAEVPEQVTAGAGVPARCYNCEVLLGDHRYYRYGHVFCAKCSVGLNSPPPETSAKDVPRCVVCGHVEDEHDGYGGMCEDDADLDDRSQCGCLKFAAPSRNPTEEAKTAPQPSCPVCGSATCGRWIAYRDHEATDAQSWNADVTELDRCGYVNVNRQRCARTSHPDAGHLYYLDEQPTDTTQFDTEPDDTNRCDPPYHRYNPNSPKCYCGKLNTPDQTRPDDITALLEVVRDLAHEVRVGARDAGDGASARRAMAIYDRADAILKELGS